MTMTGRDHLRVARGVAANPGDQRNIQLGILHALLALCSSEDWGPPPDPQVIRRYLDRTAEKSESDQ